MNSSQESRNRSNGQKIRRIKEVQDDLVDVAVSHEARIAQNERDIKVLKSRMASVERVEQDWQ